MKIFGDLDKRIDDTVWGQKPDQCGFKRGRREVRDSGYRQTILSKIFA